MDKYSCIGVKPLYFFRKEQASGLILSVCIVCITPKTGKWAFRGEWNMCYTDGMDERKLKFRFVFIICRNNNLRSPSFNRILFIYIVVFFRFFTVIQND